MRVLLVADFYPPVVGGIEQHVQHLARSLVARGHRVAVASIAPPGIHPGVEVDQGVAVHRLPSTLRRLPGAYPAAGRPLAPPAPDPELTIALGGVVRSFRPEIVHGHSWSVCSYLPLHPASGAGLVVTLHDHGLICAKKSLVYQGELCAGPAPRKCARCVSSHYGPVRGLPTLAALALTSPLVRRAADRLIAVSRAVAQASGVGDRAAVIPNFLPELPARSGTAEDLASWAAQLPRGPFLLFVGALGGHKGLPDLIAAWRQLEAAPPLVCIGHRWSDTPAEVPAGVLLYEDWPNEAVRVAWRSCVFGFIPSTWPEPFGIVALEAMDAGRAVVATRVGGLPEVVVDGETGLLVQPGDPDGLADAARRLLADAELRARLEDGALQAIDAYRPAAIVPQIEAVYVDALRRRAADRRLVAGRPA